MDAMNAIPPPPPLPATELLRGYIEPQAVDLRPDHDGQIRLSTAISLKRIADVLDGANLDGFKNQLLDIAYQAGLNFRGRA
jgi:hypothetical protein